MRSDYMLNNILSCIKLESQGPSIRRLSKDFFQKRDLVLAIRRPMIMTHKIKEKFQLKWEGPFVIETVYSNRAYRLMTPDGDMLMMPINSKFLKKYYP